MCLHLSGELVAWAMHSTCTRTENHLGKGLILKKGPGMTRLGKALALGGKEETILVTLINELFRFIPYSRPNEHSSLWRKVTAAIKTDFGFIINPVRPGNTAGEDSATKLCDTEIIPGREFSHLTFKIGLLPRPLVHSEFSEA